MFDRVLSASSMQRWLKFWTNKKYSHINIVYKIKTGVACKKIDLNNDTEKAFVVNYDDIAEENIDCVNLS
jgi:hypothetical protein